MAELDSSGREAGGIRAMGYQRYARARLFENDFLEAGSKVHPATPFLFYGSVLAALGAVGVVRHWLNPTDFAIGFPLGWVCWHGMEYAIHRCFLHWEGSGPFTRKVHAIVHGYHHQYPDDDERLVMPLGASIPLALVVGLLLIAIGHPSMTVPLFFGIVGGYLFYDFIHWSTHARIPKTRWGKAIRAHHMAHHFAVPDQNFGISHRWIDALLGTLKQRDLSSKRSSQVDAPLG